MENKIDYMCLNGTGPKGRIVKADINVSIINGEIIYYSDVNISMAVSIDKGLIVPVIKNAAMKSLAEIARISGELAEKARSGKMLLLLLAA